MTVGFTAVRDDRDPNGTPFPYVTIFDGAGEIIFGSEQFSTANLLDQDVLTITDNLEIYSGKHTFTLGANAEFYSAGNLFIPFNYGSYEFLSLDDFINDQNSDFYIRSYSLRDNIVGDESQAIAAFNAGQIGFYVQDEYQVSPDFKLTLGVRADIPFYDDTPVNEEFNNNTIPILEQFYDLRGAETGQFIDANILFSPRLGFNWDVTGKKETQLRGGIGIFTSRAPLVWVGGAFNNYGLNRGTILRFGDLPFNPDINGQVPGDIDPANAEPSGDIDLFADDFKLPQFLRGNVALDQKLPWGMTGTLDFMYTKTLQNVAYQNLNLGPAIGNLEGTPDDRPIFDRRDEVDDTYGRILLGYNTTEGYAYNISAQITKPFDNGFSGSVAYSFSDSYSIFDGTSSQNSSQWRGLHSINGRNFDQQLYRSDFAAGSRFIVGLTYALDYDLGTNFSGKTTVSLFHESAQTRPFSYIYNDGGRLQNEDSRERALIYIPQTSSDIVLIDSDDMTAAEQWAALDAFISQDEYLSENRGGYAEKNGNFGIWNHVLDLRLLQDLTFDAGGKEHTVQFTLDIFNFTNLINEDWGRRTFTGSFNNLELLDFEGFQDGTNIPEFTLNTARIDEDGSVRETFDDNGLFSSRYQIQLGLRYIFQ